MNPTPSREEDLFLDALALPSAERTAFLDQACQGDKALRDRLEVLLAAHADPKSLSGAHGLPAVAALPEEKPGDLIGRYKLLEKIGEGGCGTVYMAEQEEPVRRRVALKVIKLGMDTKAVIARFEAERQALAMMDHPNIAKVLDGGATATGRPYFVMELVRGTPVTRYCDENNLPTRERLQLFVQICQAIQHAHQKGIIHRDIKPSNILVAVHDDVAVPTVIDFGIAKATQGRLTDQTLFTAFEQFIGTPVYMSPEQAGLSSLDVDTRSDIYSLGVLLYELLTGKPPFDADTLRKAGLDEMRRIVREVEPPRPSTRLGTFADAERTAAAKVRGIAPSQLSNLIRGDLDWIAMKALEKNRVRRYETANAFAADIQRYLANEPVVARPPSTAYRFRKMVSRHRLAFAAAGVVALALVTGAIVSTWQAIRATRAEREQGRLLVVSDEARGRALAAETSERKLRENAVDEKQQALLRSSRTDFTYGSDLLEQKRVSEGLAYLARAARSDPLNYAVGPRIVAALAYRPFALPVGLTYAHDDSVTVLGFSADGTRVVAVGGASLAFWNVATGQLLADPVRLSDEEAGIQSYAMNADGSRIAVSLRDGTVRIWDVRTGKLQLGPLQSGTVTSWMRFSPDGRWFAAGNWDNNAKIWDAVTGELKATLPTRGGDSPVDFSADSSRLFTTSADNPRGWRVWSVPAGELLISASTDGGVFGARFSPDGKLLVTVEQIGPQSTGAQLWDWAAGKKVGQFMPAAERARFSPDGTRLVTISRSDRTIGIWEVPTGALLRSFVYQGVVPSISQGVRRVLFDSGHGTASIVDTNTGQVQGPLQIGDLRGGQISPDGREIWTGGTDGVVRRWRVAAGAAAPIEIAVDQTMNDGPFFAERRGLMFGFQDRLEFRDPSTGRLLAAPRHPPEGIKGRLTVSPDGKFAALVNRQGAADLWDLRNAEAIERHSLGDSLMDGRFLFSPDGTRLAERSTAGDIAVWDSSTARLLKKLHDDRDGTAGRIAFDPAGSVLAVNGAESNLTIFEIATGKPLLDAPKTGRLLLQMVFSPDRTRLATGGNEGQVELTDIASGQPVLPPARLFSSINAMRFAAGGRRLTIRTADGDFHVWDTQTGEIRSISVGAGAYDIDGTGERIAVSSLTDGMVRIWSTATGQQVMEPLQAGGRIGDTIKFSPDGRHLVTRMADRPTVEIWPLPELATATGVPDWVARLATAVAGGEIDAAGDFKEVAAAPAVFAALRAELNALPDNAPYVRWGRWFLADPETRSISPESPLTPAEAKALAGGGGAPN